MDNDVAARVEALLLGAGLSPTPDELARLVVAYPGHRHAIDSLYAIDDVRYESPGAIFDAAPTFTDWASE